MSVTANFNNHCRRDENPNEVINNINLESTATPWALTIVRAGSFLFLSAGSVTLVAGIVLVNIPALIAGSAVCVLTALAIYVIKNHDCNQAICRAVSATGVIATLEENAKAASKNLAQIMSENTKLSDENKNQKTLVSTNNVKIQELEKANEDLKLEKSKKPTNEVELNRLRKDLDTAKNSLEKKSTSLITAEQKLIESEKNAKEELKLAKESFNEESNKLQLSIDGLKKEQKLDKEKLVDLQKNFDETTKENTLLVNKIEIHSKHIEELKMENLQLNAQHLKTKTDLLKSEEKVKAAMDSPVKNSKLVVHKSKEERKNAEKDLDATDSLIKSLSGSDSEGEIK